MRQIFSERRVIGPFIEKREGGDLRRGVIEVTTRAAYDDKYGVLCIDHDATHVGGCEDEGFPSGCSLCAPFFPREERKLIDVSGAGDNGRGLATRAAIKATDEWFAAAAQLFTEAKERGPMQLPRTEASDG